MTKTARRNCATVRLGLQHGEHLYYARRLDHGADALLRDSDGETALHKARKQVCGPGQQFLLCM